MAITFAPLAWLKLQHFLHADDVEVGGFGISHDDHLLYIESFESIRQTVSMAHVELEDEAVADHFDRCADRQIPPNRCGRIWIHTHPGNCPHPSGIDERMFARVFGHCDWAVMLILAREGATYARLQLNATSNHPAGQVLLPVGVDWARFPQDLLQAEGQLDRLISGWSDEYGRNIHPELWNAFHDWGDRITYDRRFLASDWEWEQELKEAWEMMR